MRHRVSTAAFLCVALLLSATAAWASVPSLANSTVPQGIQLVGSTGGVPDAKGEAVVIVRDAGNNPQGLRAALGWWLVGFPLAALYFVMLFRLHRGKAVAPREGEGY